MNEPNEEMPVVNAKSGGLLLLIGAGLVGYFVIWAIWQVRHHAAEISYSVEGSGVGFCCLILGSLMFIAPEKTAVIMKFDKNNLKLKDILFMGGIFILGLGLVVGMDLYFSSMGYH